MAASLDALRDWVDDPRPYWELRERWKQAARVLSRLPDDAPPELLLRAFDRLLAEEPETFYRLIAKMKRRPPALFEALAHTSDLEARLLIEGERRGIGDAMAAFVPHLISTSSCPRCVEKVAAATVPPEVVEVCLALLTPDYPPFRVALAGVVAAIVVHGTAAQRDALVAIVPPDGAILWLRRSFARQPNAAPLLDAIAGRTPRNEPGEDPRRYARRFELKPSASTAPAAPPTARKSADLATLLAAVYAAPERDEPRAMYADALIETGNPLGELIQLQLARAAGKRGTKGRERLLLETHGSSLWPDHPAVRAGMSINDVDYHLDRGFPLRFSAAAPSPDVRRAITRHPGWATFRAIHGWGDGDRIEELLPEEMPLLDELNIVNVVTLDAIGARPWPIRTLGICGAVAHSFRHVDGLPSVRVLQVRFIEDPAPEVTLRALAPTGLLSRIEELVIYHVPTTIAESLATARQIEAPLLRVQGGPYPCVTARRDGDRHALTVELEDRGLDAHLTALAALDVRQISSLHLVLASDGFFTKRTRPVAEAAARAVLARFPDAKLTSI